MRPLPSSPQLIPTIAQFAIYTASCSASLYTTAYYTPDGVSRGFGVYYNKYDATAENISRYASNRYGANINYTIPLSEHDSVYASIGGEKREIVLGSNPAQYQKDFITANGNKYTQIPGNLSYVHDTRDRSIFPTKGQKHRVSLQAALPGSDLQYQKLSYDGAIYTPINDKVTFAVKGRVGVGQGSSKTGGVPFFDKYYAGGINSVRGFDQSTLGAKDENGDPKGGDLLTTATAELQFPAPFAEDVKGLKMSTFIDAGNVYQKTGDFDAKEIRYAAGAGAVWLSPIGPLELSYARPLNAKTGDKKQAVQFSIGANF